LTKRYTTTALLPLSDVLGRCALATLLVLGHALLLAAALVLGARLGLGLGLVLGRADLLVAQELPLFAGLVLLLQQVGRGHFPDRALELDHFASALLLVAALASALLVLVSVEDRPCELARVLLLQVQRPGLSAQQVDGFAITLRDPHPVAGVDHKVTELASFGLHLGDSTAAARG